MSDAAILKPQLLPQRSVGGIMGLVALALLPGISMYCATYGAGVFARLGVAIGLALALELIALRLRDRPMKRYLSDFSAALAAILVVLVMPASTSLPALSLAIVVSVLVGKHLFGGLGENVFNPAMLGCAAVMLLQPPLVIPSTQEAAAAWSSTSWMPAAFALGGTVLVARRVISWQVPAAMLLAFLLARAVITNGSEAAGAALPWQLVLAAFFIVTDPVTGCATARGRLLFAGLAGAVTAVAGGVAALPFAVLLLNGIAPWLDALFARRRTPAADLR